MQKKILILPRPHRPGFTLFELLVVVAIVVILVSIAAVGISTMLAASEFRYAASDTTALMRQARLTAANNHKPVRVSIDCRPAVPNPAEGCLLKLEVVQLKVDAATMVFDKWLEIPRFSQELPAHVKIVGDGKKDADGNLGDLGTPPDNVVAVIFQPSGRVVTSHHFPWLFTSKRFSGSDRKVSVNALTGLVESQH